MGSREAKKRVPETSVTIILSFENHLKVIGGPFPLFNHNHKTRTQTLSMKELHSAAFLSAWMELPSPHPRKAPNALGFKRFGDRLDRFPRRWL